MDRQTSNRRSRRSAFTLIEPFGFAQGKLPVVRKCRRTAFTLIELLVVIAIIALLVSMLMPSLNRAKEMAREVLCLNNVKNIGTSLQLYALNYNNTYMRNTLYVPIANNDPGEHARPAANAKWEIQLIRLGYIGAKNPDYQYEWINQEPTACGALLCPTQTPDARQDKSSYAMNGRQTAFPIVRDPSSQWYIEDRITPPAWVNLAELSSAYDMVYVFCADTRYSGYYGAPVEMSISPWIAPGEFHSGNTNVLMADFHVTKANKYEMIENPFESPFIWDR